MAGVVICPPLYAEASQNRRAEMLLTTRLAAAGLAVQRFDYAGFGNSDGSAGQLTFASGVADCLAALERFRERIEPAGLGFVGTRWGAFVATAAASRAAADALALWDPKADGRAYFAELLQVRALRDLRPNARFPADPAFHEGRLRRGIPVDLRGWRIHAPAFESSLDVALPQLATSLPPTLVVSSPAKGSRTECERLRQDLQQGGSEVDLRTLHERQWWWLTANPLMDREPVAPALESAAAPTADWLKERLTP